VGVRNTMTRAGGSGSKLPAGTRADMMHTGGLPRQAQDREGVGV
jgi:hypothetical protein